MYKRFLILLLILFGARAGAQSLDIFGGDTAVSCPAPQTQVTATCNWSSGSTTQTCTVPTGDGANYGITEPIYFSGSGTAMDSVTDQTVKASVMAGSSSVTSVIGDTLTLTAPAAASSTLTNVSVTLWPAHFYVPTDASGNPVAFSTPWGNRKNFCTPLKHWFFDQQVSALCVSLTNGVCAIGPVVSTSVSRTGGVVTLATTNTSYIWNVGMPIKVTNCADTTYNVTGVPVLSLTTGDTFTYNAAGADGTTTGCKIQSFGWDTKFASFGGTQPDSRCNNAMGWMAILTNMGFTASGEDSDKYPTPTGGCNAFPQWYPYFTGGSTPAASNYPTIDLWGCASQAVKIPVNTIAPSLNIEGAILSSGTGSSGTGSLIYDWADPHWKSWMTCNWGQGGLNILNTGNPWLIGITFDDSDGKMQTHSAGYWQTEGFNKGNPSPSPALLTLYSAPHITLSDEVALLEGIWGTPLIYPDDADYSKDVSTTPPSSCTDQSPCSLGDWLRNKYTTVSALNAAWGTSYTQWSSAAVKVTNEAVTTPASYTFAGNAATGKPITPRSISLCLNPPAGFSFVATCNSNTGPGVMVSGDCALGDHGCPTGTAGTATFLAPPNCFNGGTANFYNTVGIVCVDPNGDIEQVTAVRGSGAGKGETGTAAPAYPANTTAPGATTATLNVTFTMIGPKITGSIAYSTGAAAFTIGGAGSLPTGESLVASYSNGGFRAGGTGFEDEDGLGGRGGITVTAGVTLVCPPVYATGLAATGYTTEVSFQIAGSNFWAMALTSGTVSDPAPAFTSNPGDTITGSDGIQWRMLGAPVTDPANGQFTVACPARTGTEVNFAADMDAWNEQLFSFYYGTLRSVFNAAAPKVLNFGVNFGIGSYNSATWRGGLIAADEFTDATFVGGQGYLTPLAANTPLSKLNLDFVTRLFHHPIVPEPFMGTCGADWQGKTATCGSQDYITFDCLVPGTGCATNRAQAWYTIIQNELTYQASDGSRPFAGLAWWTNVKNDQGFASFALMDYSGNRINGHEDATGIVPCSGTISSLNCGGEAPGMVWNGKDEEHCTNCIDAGLALWLQGAAPPAPAIRKARRAIIWGVNETEQSHSPSGTAAQGSTGIGTPTHKMD